MNGNAPTLISGVPNVACSEATIRSHASAIPSAPASTCPRAAHDRRLAELADQLEQARRSARRAKCLCTSAISAAKPPRFAPEENVRSCEEREHDAAHLRRPSRARSKDSIRPPSISGESALRVSGSFSVIVATPLSSTRRGPVRRRTARILAASALVGSEKPYCLLCRRRTGGPRGSTPRRGSRSVRPRSA